jgi:hypothetical protein
MSTTIITDTNFYTLSADCWGINYNETKKTTPITIREYRTGNIIATNNVKVFSDSIDGLKQYITDNGLVLQEEDYIEYYD